MSTDRWRSQTQLGPTIGLLLALVVASCSGTSEVADRADPTPPPASTMASTAATSAVPTPTSQPSSVSSTTPTTTGRASLGPPPAALNSLEANAEDVIDLVPDEAWGAITKDVQAMQTLWASYRDAAAATDATLADRLASALTELGAASARKDGPAISQAANDVSSPVVELTARYDAPFPVQIGRLDVIGRQIVLEASNESVDAAAVQVAAAHEQWAALKDDVIARRGAAVASQADASIAALDTAIATKDTTALSTKASELLEVVDRMEELY